ncbi:MAG: tetratricopeptide repeat protein, partial [Elusimicrobiota bacterium]|nr:tetratricopeptide repeat protein [Elusimicrobiota bacterium]
MRYLCFILLLISVFATGCIFPLASVKSDEASNPKTEAAQLKSQVQTLQKKQNEMSIKTDNNQSKIETMTAYIEELQREITSIRQIVDEMQAANRNKDSGNSALDSYQDAYGDFSAGKYDLAYDEFKAFISQNPKSSLSPSAQFYMGECFYAKKMWQKAADEYAKVEKSYPKSEILAQSLLKLGLCYERLN